VSAIHDSPPSFWDQWGWPPTETSLVAHAHDHWWTLDFADVFVSPGVNSRTELVPSPQAYARNGASRRSLGDKYPPFLVIIRIERCSLNRTFITIFQHKIMWWLYYAILHIHKKHITVPSKCSRVAAPVIVIPIISNSFNILTVRSSRISWWRFAF
jgi:uncharacterized protein with PQ loop repeat